MDNKKILIIAKNYPPIKGPRAIQLMRMINAIIKYTEIEIDLITIGDNDNIEIINPRLTIYRIKYNYKKGLLNRALNKILGPVNDSLFSPFAKKASKLAEQIILEKGITSILTLSTPLDSHLAGLSIKKSHNDIKWLCFFSDPVPFLLAPFPYKEFKPFSFYQHFLMKRIMANCQMVIAPNRFILDIFQKYYNNGPNCKHFVLQHFGLENISTISSKNDGYIIHSGFFSKERVSEELFKAILELSNENDKFKGVVHLGRVSPKLLNYRKKYSCENLFKIISELPNNSAEQLQSEFPINIIIEAPMKYSPFIPSKFAEAIFTNRKIIAITPQRSSISSLWANSKQVFIANYTKDSIKEAINLALNQSETLDTELIKYYSPQNVALAFEKAIFCTFS